MAGSKQATMASAVAVALLLAMAAASVSGTVCGVDLGSMKDACGSYCARGSREARPSGQCCGVLRKANLQCLCKLKRNYGSFGSIDAGRAMQIPGKCGIGGVPSWC
ncbi:hypothetical protein ACQJBY_029264 [Aegilops geniculata]